MNYTPIRFIDEQIEVTYDHPPVREKSPSCPDGFIWRGQTYRVDEKLSEWKDFTRRGRMKRNMSPAHAAVAARRGSLGVGRFYFRAHTRNGRVFDLYYDRAPEDSDRRKGTWYLYREMSEEDPSEGPGPSE